MRIANRDHIMESWRRARSVFLSDLHLGWRYSHGFEVASYLAGSNPDYLYLIGDTFEWFRHEPFTSRSDAAGLLRQISRLAKNGTEVFLLPGNHDSALADSNSTNAWWTVVEWTIRPHVVHKSVDGGRYLVMHGDIFDMQFDSNAKWRRFGSHLYPWLVRLGDRLHRWGVHPKATDSHWCTYWKFRSTRSVHHIRAYAEFMTSLALSQDCHGVVCGHIHFPANERLGETRYLNCGDWVEHRSCVVESPSGELEMLNLQKGRPNRWQPLSIACAEKDEVTQRGFKQLSKC